VVVVVRFCSTTSAGSGAGAVYELLVDVVVFVISGCWEHAASKGNIVARMTMAFFMIFSSDGGR
jgi:hypothetical protein